MSLKLIQNDDVEINDIVIPKDKITFFAAKILNTDPKKLEREMYLIVMDSLSFTAYLNRAKGKEIKVSDIDLDEFMVSTPQDLVYLQNLKESLERYCI